MRIVSVRLSDDEYESLVHRAGKGRGALSNYLRRLLKEPRYAVMSGNTMTTEEAAAAGREIVTQLKAYLRAS